MYHHAARTRDRRLAFSTWEEGVRLFHTVAEAAPGLRALCVMPDHIHVLCPGDVRSRLGTALGGYARRRNRRHGTRGALWQRLSDPVHVTDETKRRLTHRYIHLNPCRARLVSDPLAWPLSTHLDAVGLVQSSVVRRATDPVRFHRWVSGDPHVAVSGTDLPFGNEAEPAHGEVLDAVSVVTRTPLVQIRRHARARRLAIRSLRVLTSASRVEIAKLTFTSRNTVGRVSSHVNDDVRLVERWVGDARCTPLDDGVLSELLRRSCFRHRVA